MAKRKFKLFLLVFVGLFIFSVGYIFAQKYQGNAAGQIASVFPSQLDSDNDGLTDSKEKELGTNPYLADSDSDGFNDKQEIDNKHDPNKAESNDLIDQDQDGLIGLDEKKYNTDPNKSDTDYDGYSDGEEIANGFDPTQANLTNIKTLLSQIPEDKKEEAKEITGLDLTSASSVDSLQNVLNSDQSAELSQFVDQIVASTNSQLDLIEVSDSEIKISNESANSESVANYFSQFDNATKQNLNFLIDPAIQDEMISKYGSQGASQKIAEGFSNSVNELKKIEVPNDSEFIALHKKTISVFLTLSQKYEIIANSNDNNLPTLSQVLKDVLSLNRILEDEIFNKINELARAY